MTRIQYPSVSEAAQQILREIEAEEQIKTAEQLILRNAEQPVHIEMAHDIIKLAEQCRCINVDNPVITYDDLYSFMRQCNGR